LAAFHLYSKNRASRIGVRTNICEHPRFDVAGNALRVVTPLEFVDV